MRAVLRVLASLTTAALLLGCGGTRPSPVEPTATPAGAPPSGDDRHADLRVAFVLTDVATTVDAAVVAAAYARLAPDGPQLTNPEVQDGTLTFDLGGGVAGVAMMPAPVPGHEAEDGAQFSLSRWGLDWHLAPHGAHLLVSVVGNPASTPRQRLRTLHRWTAAVARAVGDHARGVYVGGVTHEPKYYVDAVAEFADPLIVWCGVSVARPGGRLSLLSIGMPALGLPDVLMTASGDEPGETIMAFFDLLAYIAEREAPLPAGDTVGRSADERVPVRYQASPIDPKVQVMAVDYP